MFKTYKINHHLQIKKDLLRYIENDNQGSIKEKQDSITKSDYYNTNKKEYFKHISNSKIFEKIAEDFFIEEIDIKNVWYQQYRKNDKHNFHIHDCMMSFIYFVELSDRAHATEFFDVENKSIVRANAVEGDVLIFNSYVPHRSPVLIDDTQKTIISINFNFKGLSNKINDTI